MFIWQNSALTRDERIVRLLPTIGFIAFAVLWFVDIQLKRPNVIIQYCGMASLLLVGVGLLLMKRSERRARQLIRSGQVGVCPGCCYSLAGLDASGDCPECGVSYSPETLQQRWAVQYNMWDLVDPEPKPLPFACPNCEYSLKGLNATGRCPECGNEYSPDLLREEWARKDVTADQLSKALPR